MVSCCEIYFMGSLDKTVRGQIIRRNETLVACLNTWEETPKTLFA